MADVLYVDDEEPIRRALRSLLGRRGHTIYTAGSVAEAINVLETHQVDGVFIDIWLGQESGFDLFELIEKRWPGVARNAAFVTGAVLLDPGVEQTLNGHDRPVLSKPFEFDELERVVNAW